VCFNGRCFNFEQFKGKRVAVFISGPGDLEYSWALETALRLNGAGAKTTMIDLSDYSLRYSARIRFLGFRLHHRSRRFLRSLFLSGKMRIENKVSTICREHDIEWARFFSKSSLGKFFYSRKTTLTKLKGVHWGPIDAEKIIHSTFSSNYRRSIGSDEQLGMKKVLEIEGAISQTLKFLQTFKFEEYTHFFMANGRQPVSACLTLFLREKGKGVYLYESAGGYVFPELLDSYLDYWESSPANPAELQAKVMCEQNFKNVELVLLAQVSEIIKSRSSIAYSVNYLTDSPTYLQVDRSLLSRVFVFFATTDWEFSILYSSSGAKSDFVSQFDAVQAIISNLEPQESLIIRLHPSDPNKSAPADDGWQKFALDRRVIIIPPESRIDSYKLAADADGNFVWTSFLGYELALRGIPVAVMGEAIYAKCFPENYLLSHEGLEDFMQHPSPPSLELIDRYTNYLARGGFEILSSKTYPGRRIFIHGQQVDTFRKVFGFITDKIRLKIS
jgi:hypothetical protein